MRRALLLVLALGAVLAAAAPAQANFVASATDPAGDATDPSPGRDVIAFALDYEPRTGSLTAGVRLAGSPRETPSFVTVAAGVKTPTGCNGYPAATIGAGTGDFDARWFRLDAPGAPAAASGRADKRGVNAAEQSFTAEASQLQGGRYDCATVILSEPGNAANVHDVVEADLIGRPGLSLTAKRVPKQLAVGGRRTIRMTVRNTGDGPATGVQVRLRKTRGVTVTPARRKLGTLRPGASRTVRMTVALGRRAATVSRLALSATGSGLVAKGELSIRRKDKPKPGGGGGSQPGTPSTCVRYAPDPFGDSGGSLVLVPCVR